MGELYRDGGARGNNCAKNGQPAAPIRMSLLSTFLSLGYCMKSGTSVRK